MAYDLTAPAFEVYIEDTLLMSDIAEDIVSLEFEHTLLAATMLTLTINNADQKYTDLTTFSPGNETEIHLGYGLDVGPVGRGEIVRHLPSYPQDGVPTLQIKAYDRSHRMMAQELAIAGGGSKRPQKKAVESGVTFIGDLGTIVSVLLQKHGIAPAVDAALYTIKPGVFAQRKGMTDYQVVRALANIYNADFVVEWDFVNKFWLGKFTKSRGLLQTERYTFTYAQGNDSNILSCDLDFGLPQSPTELQVWHFEENTKTWIPLSVEEAVPGKPEDFDPSTVAAGGALGPGATIASTAGEIKSMSRFKLAAQGHAFVVNTQKFRDPAAALSFLQGWYQRYKDAFVIAQVRVPGVPTLRAGQTHEMVGLGNRYDGKYYISNVKHQMDASAGYVCEFTGHKVIE